MYKELYNLLDIPSLINIFFQNYPFSQYINVTYPATFVYEYFVESYNHIKSKKLNTTSRNLSKAVSSQ